MPSLEEIEKMEIKQVVKIYDKLDQHTVYGTDAWWKIFISKKEEKANRQMLKYTKYMFYLTIAVVSATIVSLIVSFISLWISLH